MDALRRSTYWCNYVRCFFFSWHDVTQKILWVEHMEQWLIIPMQMAG